MKRTFAVFALLLCLAAVPAHAQTQTETDSPKSTGTQVTKPHLKIASKKFWIFAGLQIGATIADFETTQWALRSNPQAREINPLFGQRPSRLKMYGIGMPITVFQIALQHHAKGIADRTGKARGAWIVGASINTGLHTFLAVHNAGLVGQSVCPAQGTGCR
jgi:hypothetical protein